MLLSVSFQACLQFPFTCQVTLSPAIFCSFLNERFSIVPTRSSLQVHSGSLPRYRLKRADFDVVETPSQGKSLFNSIGDAGLFGLAKHEYHI